MGPMIPINWLPSAHPITGMPAWKPPKNRPSTTATLRLIFFMPRPLQMETAKASIERPMASNTSSTSPIVWLPLCGQARVYLLGEQQKD